MNCFMVLVLLYKEGPMTVSKISNRLCLSKQQMTPITYKLLVHGYVIKGASPFDHRFVIISLTAKGEALLQRHIERMQIRLNSYFSAQADDEAGTM